MSKLKNHSGAKKRFKVTGSGLKMRSPAETIFCQSIRQKRKDTLEGHHILKVQILK